MKYLSSSSVQVAIRKKLRQELCLEEGNLEQALSSDPKPRNSDGIGVPVSYKTRRNGEREWIF